MRVGIIGGGAAGMSAAAFCAADSVTLLEKNEKLGKKVYITGKGRCNVTNNCALYEFFPSVIRGSKFMMSSLTAFPAPSLMEFLAEHGVRTKTERGNRVFPASDKASDVIKAFASALERNNVDVRLNTEVESIENRGGVFYVATSGGKFEFDRLIVAAG